MNTEEKKQKIIDMLRGKPQFNNILGNEIDKKNLMARQTFFTLRDILIREGKIIRTDVGRRVVLSVPCDKAKLTDFLLTNPKRKEIKQFIQGSNKKKKNDWNVHAIKHTNDIKNKVIKPWLEQLPIRQKLGIAYPKEFTVQNHVLFADFKKNHVRPEFGNPFDELEKLYGWESDFREKVTNLRENIFYNIIGKEIDRSPAEFEPDEDMPNVEKDMRCYIGERNEAMKKLTDWIVDILDWVYPSFHEDSFDYLCSHIPLSIKETESSYECYITDDYSSQGDLFCGRIRKQNASRIDFLEMMDECIEKIVRKAQNSEVLQKDISVLHEIQHEMVSHVEKIRKSLNKHLELPLLPNDCEYCC